MNGVKRLCRFLLLLAGCAAGATYAADIAGVKLDDTVRVANQDLVLNGAGIRHKLIFKVYVAGLHLPEKKASVSEVISASGPKRVTLVMLRDLSSEELSRGFMTAMQQNIDKAEKAKLVNQMRRFGELFASVPELKKGDVLTVDWVPGTGTALSQNGKQISDPLPDVAFYNALLKIWLGDNPVDAKLKSALLGMQQ